MFPRSRRCMRNKLRIIFCGACSLEVRLARHADLHIQPSTLWRQTEHVWPYYEGSVEGAAWFSMGT